MFEFTKLIYLRQCIFIHLYFYFSTMFFCLCFSFVAFLYLICKIFHCHITIVVTTENVLFDLFCFKEVMIGQSDPARVNLCTTCMWTNQLINSKDSIFRKDQ